MERTKQDTRPGVGEIEGEPPSVSEVSLEQAIEDLRSNQGKAIKKAAQILGILRSTPPFGIKVPEVQKK